MTPREIVTRCLRFASPARIPRDLWILPWASQHHPGELNEILKRFPPDFSGGPTVYQRSPRLQGDPYTLGLYTDEWGCTFTNIQEGAIGEVRDPMVLEIADWRQLQPPYEILPGVRGETRDTVNRFCGSTELFVLSDACPRPWERYQFIRGSENALMDVGAPDTDVLGLLHRIHDFYMKELEFWVSTDVDAVRFMDDWGSQKQLLISPRRWREMFKPLYRDYCDLAHANGKFIFMHSDGNITDIFPDIVEIGVDAINAQLFCMDMRAIASLARGKITFWGEIDRQHVLPSPDPEKGREAVRAVAEHLYDPAGGVIAQLEFGLAANPDTVRAVFEEWERIGSQRTAH